MEQRHRRDAAGSDPGCYFSAPEAPGATEPRDNRLREAASAVLRDAGRRWQPPELKRGSWACALVSRRDYASIVTGAKSPVPCRRLGALMICTNFRRILFLRAKRSE